ncbi:MAG: aspartate aminotransferase family protein [Caulobacteraceae bacterium]|nr:aspartate aminotransferase family protein [Caulobacteraceae bacterium]
MNSPTPPNSLDAYWMPFTPNKRFKAQPRQVVRAEGMYYTADDGRAVLDATAGLWCVNAGHGRTQISDAIAAQARELGYATNFNLGHPKAFEFASRLARLLPDDIDHVFFTNSGSEAVDTALKIALAYQQARGHGQKTRLIGRERGYHGVGFGGLSVGGIGANRSQFGPLLTGVDHLVHTHDPVRNGFAHGLPVHGAELADDLERIVTLHGASTIAAVIVEPVAGSTGVLPPPQGYLQRLRQICDRHDILLIFDEVITAFGRLGAATAAEAFGVTPDILTLAKGITNAAVPMGAAAVRSAIYETLVDGGPQGIELFHGYTYSGHPLACAAGLATLDIYRDEALFERAASLAPVWEAALHSLRDAPHVVDIRNIGLMGAVELSPRDGKSGERGQAVFHRAFDDGMLVRLTGDTVALSPSLIVTEAQIDEIVSRLQAVLGATV